MDVFFASLCDGAPATSRGGDTVVPWWSVTKTAIAATALSLAADGRLDLDAPLPDVAYSLRQLLRHRAGVADYGGLPAYHEAVARGDEPWTRDDFMERTEASRLRSAPDEVFAYSNIGYLLAVEAIERAGGGVIGAVMAARLFRPLGLTGVRFAHRPDDLNGVVMGVPDYHPGWVAHGLLVGPLAEAARMIDGILGGALLPGRLLDEMRDGLPVGGDVPDRIWREPAYGLGLMMDRTLPGEPQGHTGGGPGSTIAVYRTVRAGAARTVAAFRTNDTQGDVEAFAMMADI